MHCSPGWSSRQALTRVLHCAAPRCLALQVGGGWVIVHGPPIGAAARQGPLPARAESQSLPNPSHPLFPAASRCSHPANSSPLPTSPSDLRPPRGHQKAPDFCHFLSAKLEPIVATLLRHPQGHSCDSQAVATRFSAARATLRHALELGPDRSSSRASAPLHLSAPLESSRHATLVPAPILASGTPLAQHKAERAGKHRRWEFCSDIEAGSVSCC